MKQRVSDIEKHVVLFVFEENYEISIFEKYASK